MEPVHRRTMADRHDRRPRQPAHQDGTKRHEAAVREPPPFPLGSWVAARPASGGVRPRQSESEPIREGREQRAAPQLLRCFRVAPRASRRRRTSIRRGTASPAASGARARAPGAAARRSTGAATRPPRARVRRRDGGVGHPSGRSEYHRLCRSPASPTPSTTGRASLCSAIPAAAPNTPNSDTEVIAMAGRCDRSPTASSTSPAPC